MSGFLSTAPAEIVGVLSTRHVDFHASAEAEQVHAWSKEIELLRSAFLSIGARCNDWSVLLEYPLLRLAKRIDAVVLAPGIVNVVEFKTGKSRFIGVDRDQTELYAHALRDFHEVARQSLIVPILCAELAPAGSFDFKAFDQVADLIEVGGGQLAEALSVAESQLSGVSESACNWPDFDKAAYRPTPTIVDAARSLYSGHQIAEIGRGDAADAELQVAAQTLNGIVDSARSERGRTICFVTGAPGAGKTLLGLNLALSNFDDDSTSALLSGNRPLVHVLTEALAEDAASRNGTRKGDEKYRASAAIQNLLGYLKEHTDGAVPPEHVIVFDEAQRAWDAEVGQKLMGRPQSEPELFLDILSRLDWSCLVCLVGPGQEINRGEGGLSLWGDALAKAAREGSPWTVIAAPQALAGGPDVAGPGLLANGATLRTREERRIHLTNSVRAYRNELHGKWVAQLLEGNLADCRSIACEMTGAPALVARDLSVAKSWLLRHRRGGRSVGLLASSGAIRLVAEGLPPTPRSNELDQIGHWFLKAPPDFRSSGALEVPLSEFGCQGLEIDYAGVCWGGDLLWSDEGWSPRRMQSPHWRRIKDETSKRFRINGYRVLLTRARAGLVIFVPQGSEEDVTRSPVEFDQIAEALLEAGCEPLW